MKLKRIVEALIAAVSATFTLAQPAQAQETFEAPHWKFDVQCLEAKPEHLQEVVAWQARIADLRARGEHFEADIRHEAMCRDLMRPKWREVKVNTVTTVGKNDLLDKYFAGSSYTAAWFCGLISSVSYSAISAADTMSSHAGWTEAGGTNAPTYSGNRPAITFASASGGSKATSSASSFTFTGTGTIKGMFGTTVTTKDGTTGILYNAVLFTGGDRAVVSTDVVNVSITYSV